MADLGVGAKVLLARSTTAESVTHEASIKTTVAPLTLTLAGGNGTWNTTSPVWQAPDGRMCAWVDGATAVFGGAPKIVTLAGAFTLTAMQFKNDGFIITGGQIVSGENGLTIDAAAGFTVTMRTPITGAGGVVKTGTGTLRLAVANTYTGLTEINGGKVRIDADQALPATAVVQVGDLDFGSGILDLNGHNLCMGGLATGTSGGLNNTYKDTVTNSSATAVTLTIDNAADYVYNGTLTGNLALDKYGPGKQVFGGINTNTGDVAVYDGNLKVLGSFTVTPHTVAGSGNPQITGADDPYYTLVTVSAKDGYGAWNCEGDLVAETPVVFASNWQEAVVSALTGTIIVTVSDVPGHPPFYFIPSNVTIVGPNVLPPTLAGQPKNQAAYTPFLVGTVADIRAWVAQEGANFKIKPGDEGIDDDQTKVVVLEDWTNDSRNDYDYDDTYWVINTVAADLDVDSDNNDKAGVPARTTEEETLEDAWPGKLIATSMAENDGDTRYRFVPMVLELQLDYESDDVFRFTGDGFITSNLKIWKVDGTQARTGNDLLAFDTPFASYYLGINPSQAQVTLYLEAANTGRGTITLQTKQGTGDWCDLDSVNVTVINDRISCSCCSSGTRVEPDGQRISSESDLPGGGTRTDAPGTVNDRPAGESVALALTGNAVAVLRNDSIALYDYELDDGTWTLTPRRAPEVQGTMDDSSDYVETDPAGVQWVFAEAGDHPLVQVVPPGDGQTDRTYDSSGRLTTEETVTGPDAGRTVTYSYDNNGRLTQEVTSVRSSSSSADVQKAFYSYYTSGEANGNDGDLKLVEIRDGAGNTLEYKYYRYYKANNPDGFEHAVKYVLTGDAFARAQEALGGVSGVCAATDAQIAVYADDFFKYDSEGRVRQRTSAQGGCSLCNGQGAVSYAYAVSTFSDAVNNWKYKTTQTQDDGSQTITYINYQGQTLLTKTVAGGNSWVTVRHYDANGNELWTANPSAVISYADTQADLGVVLQSTTGLIQGTEYYVPGDFVGANPLPRATDQVAGGVVGYARRSYVQQGSSGEKVYESEIDYIARSAGNQTIYLTKHVTQYNSTDLRGAQTTTYDYTFVANSIQIASQTITLPKVLVDQHGSGDSDSSTIVLDSFGRVAWSRDEAGFITHTEYDARTGAVIRTVRDVNTALTDDEPAGWQTPTEGGAHLVYTYEVDTLGRTIKATDPNGVVDCTVYLDAAHETRLYPGWHESAPGKYTTTGPVEVWRNAPESGYSESLSFAWTDPNGLPVANGLPTGAESLTSTYAAIQSLTRSYVNAAGQMIESRAYTNLGGIGYSTNANLGALGTNYLQSTYTYDPRGRMAVTVDAAGTITHTFYDQLGRQTATWVGTDDVYDDNDLNKDGLVDLRDFRSWVSLNSGATQGPADTTMMKVSASVYDNGGTGDSLLTISTNWADSATNYVTTFAYDWRERMIAARGPDGVVAYRTYDNLGRATVSQTYADSDNDMIVAGQPLNIEAEELRSQTESLFDDLDRVYESRIYAVDPVSGVAGGYMIVYSAWFNSRGLTAKTTDASEVFTKTFYDGVGRAVANYTSYDDDEDGYREAMAIGGDTVISVTQAVYVGSRISEIKQGTTLANAVATIKYVYDDDSGRLTGVQTLRPLASLSETDADYVLTAYAYDLAGRQNAVTLPDPDGDGPLHDAVSRTTYNFLGQTLTQGVYELIGGNATLLAQATYEYNDYGQLEAARQYEVVGGVAGDSLETTYDYDFLGRQVKVTRPDGGFTKTEYNLLGQTTRVLVGTEQAPLYPVAPVVDIIVEQTDYAYDGAGALIQTTQYSRYPGSTATGAFEPSTTAARVSYSAAWYDGLGRVIATADYGATGQSFTRPGTAPTPSSATDVNVTRYDYDGLGRRNQVTDNAGRVNLTVFDSAGRVAYQIANFLSGSNYWGEPIIEGDVYSNPLARLSDINQITKYEYNAAGQMIRQIALDPSADGQGTGHDSDNQTTRYFYSSELDDDSRGSVVPRGDLVRAVRYPDSTLTDAAVITLLNGTTSTGSWLPTETSDLVVTSYYANGQTWAVKDQRGVAHAYA